MTDQRPFCINCRFYCDDGDCINSDLRTVDLVHGYQYAKAKRERMQGEKCGVDGKLFEIKPPPPFIERYAFNIFFLTPAIALALLFTVLQ